MFHPTLSGNKGGGEDDWEEVLQSQRMFMAAKHRQKPAASVVRAPQVEKDIITLEATPGQGQQMTGTRPPILSGQRQESRMNKNLPGEPEGEDPRRPPVETDAIDVLSDIVEREVNNKIYKPPTFTNSIGHGGFPSVFKRERGPLLARKRGKKTSLGSTKGQSKFSKMLQNERKNMANATAANSSDDIDKTEIHRENLQRLAAMTKSELEQARNDLISSMSPELLALFKKKQKNKTKAERPSSKESTTLLAQNKSTDDMKRSAGTKIEAVISEGMGPVTDGSNAFIAKITSEEELDNAVVNLSSELEKEKLSWTGKVGQQPKPKSKLFYKTQPRFDLKGAIVVLENNATNETKANAGDSTSDVRKVGEREGEIYGLYHHGQDPDAPGYTFADLLHLSRSVVTPQRLTALRAVTSILEKRRSTQRKQRSKDTRSPSPLTLSNKLGDVLVMGINCNVNSIVQHSIDAIYFWLVPEEFIELNTPSPYYRRYELCPHPAIAQEISPSIKLTPIADPFGDDMIALNSKDDEGDGTTEEGKVEKLKSEDPIRWLLRMGILDTYTRILSDEGLFPATTYKRILATLTYMASHSKVVSLNIWRSEMMSIVRNRFVEGNDKSLQSSLAGNAVQLLRTLCQGSFSMASDIIKTGIGESIKRYFVGYAIVGDCKMTTKEWETCVLECMQLWRITLLYGLDQDSVQNTTIQIRKLVDVCRKDSQISKSFCDMLERFLYSIYSAYCVSIHQSMKNVATIPESLFSETRLYVDQALQSLLNFRKVCTSESGIDPGHVYQYTSGPLHFLATYLNLGAYNESIYRRACNAISGLILSVDGSTTSYFDDLKEHMKNSGNTSESFIDSLHGLVRCLEALLKNEKINKNLAFDFAAHDKFSSSILSFMSGFYLDKSVSSTYHRVEWTGLAPYKNRSFTLLLSNAIVYLRKLYIQEEARGKTSDKPLKVKEECLSVMSDVLALLVSKVLPGDEYMFTNSINLFLTICFEKKWIGTGETEINDLNALKTYFATFAGSRVLQDHSGRLFSLQSSSIALDKTFSLIPRVRGQIPSVLPLPLHWLLIPLTLDGSASNELFCTSIGVISSLEMNEYFSRGSIAEDFAPAVRVFCWAQVFLFKEGDFIFDTNLLPKLEQIFEKLFAFTNVFEVLETCGIESVEALGKSLINIFFQTSYGNAVLSKVICFFAGWTKMRKFLWRQGIKHRMLYLLENNFKDYGNHEYDNSSAHIFSAKAGARDTETTPDDSKNFDDNNMIDLYCESIVSEIIDQKRAPSLYGLVTNRIYLHAQHSSAWMKAGWKERLGNKHCPW